MSIFHGNNKTKRDTIILTLMVIFVGAFGNWSKSSDSVVIYAKEPPKKEVVVVKMIPEDIRGYIAYKFGESADKALRLLDCENKKLDPNATNDNRTWGGVGVDRGYWQINNVYHPFVSDACASDVKCSTDYAYRMWKNDGESFRRWTCGKNLGI